MKVFFLVLVCATVMLVCPQGGRGKRTKSVHQVDTKEPLPQEGIVKWTQGHHKRAKQNRDKPSSKKEMFTDNSAPRNAIDDMKTRFDNMRAELGAKADGFSRRAKKMVERAKAGLVSLHTRWNELAPERRGAIAGALNTAAGKLSSFKDISGDPITALKGAIEIAATFANIAGPHGMVVGVALNFISGFLSLFGLGGGAVSRTPMHLIVRQEIEKWYSEHMTNMARGAIGDFETSQAFLDGVISDLGPDQKLNDSTAIALQIHIPVYRNIAFMEYLKAQIEDMKDENRDEDAQKCLKYIELWARMALLKDIILQRMAAIMPESQRSIRAGFYSVQSSLREKARNLFKFLWEAGVGSKIIPYFDPDEKGVVDEYLSTVLEETNYDRSMGGLYKIFVQMAPNSYGTMGFWWATPLVSSEQMASILDGQTHGFPLDFKWKLVPHGNNLFTIISKKDCPDGINCNAYLSWTPDGNLHYATVKKSDPVLWEITRSGGEYRIRSKRGCDSDDAWCNAELSWKKHGNYKTGQSWYSVLLDQSEGKSWILNRE